MNLGASHGVALREFQLRQDAADYLLMDDFDDVPFHERGGRMKVYKLFGDEAPNILNDLNGALAA